MRGLPRGHNYGIAPVSHHDHHRQNDSGILKQQFAAILRTALSNSLSVTRTEQRVLEGADITYKVHSQKRQKVRRGARPVQVVPGIEPGLPELGDNSETARSRVPSESDVITATLYNRVRAGCQNLESMYSAHRT